MGEVVSELSANRNLHPLDGVHHQEAQLAIEGVTGPNDLQCRARAKGVVYLAERVEIAAKAVVVDRLQFLNQIIAVGLQASTQKEVCLIGEGQRGFGIFHLKPPYKKKPAEVRMRNRGAAGILEILCIIVDKMSTF